MLTEPVIEHRSKQAYAAIRTTVAMQSIGDVLPGLTPQVEAWLKEKNVQPSGPLFFKYLSWNKNNQMEVEVGFPIQQAVEGDDRIVIDYFPEGRYAKLTHMGNYNHLKDAHMFLESWGKEKGLRWKEWPLPDGIQWGGRTEFYVNDCNEIPDPDKWQTDIVFLLAD